MESKEPVKPAERKFANTTSSLYIDSTISSPNVIRIIQAVATILNSQMLEVINHLKKQNPKTTIG